MTDTERFLEACREVAALRRAIDAEGTTATRRRALLTALAQRRSAEIRLQRPGNALARTRRLLGAVRG